MNGKKENIAAVTYSYNTIPCLKEDETCIEQREKLLNYFSSNYDIHYKGYFYEQEMYIFLKRTD